MNLRFFALVALLGSAVACSDSSSSAGVGSCTQTQGSTTFCADYNSNVSATNARSTCTSASGSYSTSACTSTNRVGRCVAPGVVGGVQTTSTLNFYTPATDADARQVCTAFGGTYTAG